LDSKGNIFDLVGEVTEIKMEDKSLHSITKHTKVVASDQAEKLVVQADTTQQNISDVEKMDNVNSD
jgi:hypothetical protein